MKFDFAWTELHRWSTDAETYKAAVELYINRGVNHNITYNGTVCDLEVNGEYTHALDYVI